MRTHEFQRLVDRGLSGLVWEERQCQRVRRALDEEEKPVKKLSTVLVVVLLLLALTMAAALAAGGFGMLELRENQKENVSFNEHIFTVGQSYEFEAGSIRLNEAVFNGTRLYVTMDVVPAEGAAPVLVYPRITAEADGKPLRADVTGFVGQFPDGFWMPNVEGLEDASPTRQGIEVTLTDESGVLYAPQSGNVAWTVSFDVYKPNWPIRVTRQPRPSHESGEPFYTEAGVAMDKPYDEQFAKAYEQGDILLQGACGYTALGDYGRNVPQPDGATRHEDVENALRSQAFTHTEKAVFTFSTQAQSRSGGQIGRAYALTGGWQAELVSLNAAFDRIDCTLRLTRQAGDGRTAAEAYLDGEYPWDFAMLSDGGKTMYPSANGYVNEDGSVMWIGTAEVMNPVGQITLVPCRSDDAWLWLFGSERPERLPALPPQEKAERICENQAPITDEQRALAFVLELP